MLTFIIFYSVAYFVFFYGCHFGNLLLRRILFKNLRISALIAIAIVAAIHFILIDVNAPEEVDKLAFRVLQMQMTFIPVAFVAAVVRIKMWLENR
ncbi:hypothetical protein [Acidovorax sp. NCPPB 4044]|uniref:hypothetical protein n=1 Tax=Acidovorax sp. NCPPB 4044 TaxID=2940490 RepID=UPI002303F42D|nr:hypothetical protein [Acidovorax sp. NCPPB 4044]MDA8522942.1 hypothetical protein [Acidovorax sp. NCPPB 4044]